MRRWKEVLSRIGGLVFASGDADEAFRFVALARDPKQPGAHLGYLYSGIEKMFK